MTATTAKLLVAFSLIRALQFYAEPLVSAAETDLDANDVSAGMKRYWTASVRWENDTFGGTDRYYTDGVFLGIEHTGASWLDPVADWLPWGEGRRTVAYDLTQAMLTPSDTTRSVPDPTDRPYAGVLTFGLSLQIDTLTSYNGLKFITGVVGPWSLAGDTQREVHRLGGWGLPQGWHYQLKNEPILNLVYEYRHKFRLVGRPDGWSAEALPLAGGWLGNLLTQGQVGGLVRFGYNVPEDFGVTLARGMGQLPPPWREESTHGRSGWGFSIYGGGIANLVLRDLTLDGNTFENGPSVNKEFFVPAGGFGAAINNRRFLASFTYVIWGKEFEAQKQYSKFGALTFSYFF